MTTKSDDAELGAGDYTIENFMGQTIVLKPTLECCLSLTRYPGGLYRASNYGPPSLVDKLISCDLDVMAMVLRAGLGLGASAVKDLEEGIFRFGLVDMRDELSAFVGIVASGGRRPKNPGEGDGEQDARPLAEGTATS